MGVVYRAYDERLDRWVAVKVLPAGRSSGANGQERFRREARASAQLNHPAIVRIYDLVDAGDSNAIVMELVEGESLERRIRERTVDLSLALSVARQVAEALVAAHSRGIIHRDLKSENVLVTPGGEAKVLDFGVARWLDRGDASLTAAGAVIGTPRAMSPEQATGERVEASSDLFSLGTLLYELFTGTSPFLGASVRETLGRVCTHRQKPARALNAALPQDLSDLIDQLLEKDRHLRPRNAGEVVLALAGIARAFTPSSGAPPSGSAPGGAGGPLTFPASGVSETLLTSQTAAERRRVTVLCCGLTRPGGESLDPEEMLEAMDRLEATVAAAVGRYGGRLERGGSGGWRACFGYPRAHEDDARRAVSAALEIASRADERGAAVHLGAHTGTVVVPRIAPGGALPLGETSNVAALLQGLAAPGSLLLGPETCRLVEGFFETEELAPVSLPGQSQPLRVHRVRSGSSANRRFLAAGGPAAFVGRDQELGLLLERWALVREGRGQAVLLSGEAGLGKSRLVWELRQRAGSGVLWLEAQASPFLRDSAFHPILQWLDQWMGAERDDPAEVRRSRLEEAVRQHGLPVEETVPLLAGLLSLPAEGPAAAPPASPEVQRRRTHETLLALFLAAGERQPLFLVMEDLHWADPSSLELLGVLAENLAALPIFLLLTLRPEVHLDWNERSHLTRLGLGPLPRRQTDLLIQQLTAGRELAAPVLEQIARRTDGVPLFIEELIKMILAVDRAPGAAGGLEIPDRLEEWLGARLDRLGGAKEVAQLAAILGREFPEDLLGAVSPWNAADLERDLDRLAAAEILHRQGLPSRRRYRFKHALLRDAAYASLLRADRQRFHLRVAQVLEDRFPHILENQPEIPAHHFTEAGRAEEALVLWRRAGDRAAAIGGYAEAVAHLSRALALLSELAESPERDQREIALQVALGSALGIHHHRAHGRVQEAFSRAWELCRRAGPHPDLFPVLRGLFGNFIAIGQAEQERECAEELVRLAELQGDPLLLLSAHQAQGAFHMMAGEHTAAVTHLERGLAQVGDEHPAFSLALAVCGDAEVESLVSLAWSLWFLGCPDAALRRSREALERAPQGPPRIFATFYGGQVHLFRGETEAALQLMREAQTICEELEIFGLGVVATFALGGGLVAAGRTDEGVTLIEQSRAIMEREQVTVWMPVLLAPLVRACLDLDMPDRGLAVVADLLAVTAATDQRMLDAELLRLRAALLAQKGENPKAVENALHEALSLARGQGARSLDLRASTDLARLWAGQGRRAEARDLLAGVYDQFTEGFDTVDLRAARDLLATLEPGREGIDSQPRVAAG